MALLFTKFLLPIALAIGFTAQSAEAGTRVESTNRASSAPLNLVNRSFARIEKDLNRTWPTERLTFLALSHQEINNPEKMIEKLLLDISGGPHEARVLDLKMVTQTENSIHNAVEDFLAHPNLSDLSENAKFNSFRAAVKAALMRSDVLLYTAQLLRNDGLSRVLILTDGETKDIVLVSIGQAALR